MLSESRKKWEKDLKTISNILTHKTIVRNSKNYYVKYGGMAALNKLGAALFTIGCVAAAVATALTGGAIIPVLVMIGTGIGSVANVMRARSNISERDSAKCFLDRDLESMNKVMKEAKLEPKSVSIDAR